MLSYAIHMASWTETISGTVNVGFTGLLRVNNCVVRYTAYDYYCLITYSARPPSD